MSWALRNPIFSRQERRAGQRLAVALCVLSAAMLAGMLLWAR